MTVLNETDKQADSNELTTEWVDTFLELCSTSPTDEQRLRALLARLDELEALGA